MFDKDEDSYWFNVEEDVSENEWGHESLNVCECSELTMAECAQYCLILHEPIELPLSDNCLQEDYTRIEQRIGTLDEFDLNTLYVAQIDESSDGDMFEEFPDLDLPDWSSQNLVDCYRHPSSQFVYVEVYEWPGGEQRKLLRQYK